MSDKWCLMSTTLIPTPDHDQIFLFLNQKQNRGIMSETIIMIVPDFQMHFYFPLLPSLPPVRLHQILEQLFLDGSSWVDYLENQACANLYRSSIYQKIPNTNRKQFKLAPPTITDSFCVAWHYQDKTIPLYDFSAPSWKLAKAVTMILSNTAFWYQKVFPFASPQVADEFKQLISDDQYFVLGMQMEMDKRFLVEHQLEIGMVVDQKHWVNTNTSTVYSFPYIVKSVDDLPPFEANDNPLLGRTLFFDIECMNTYGFPNSRNKSDEIICISTVLYDEDEPMDDFLCFTNSPVEQGEIVSNWILTKTEGFEKPMRYIECASEQELLLRFLEYWNVVKPNNMSGFNIINFDITYMLDRMSLYSIDASFNYIKVIWQFNVESDNWLRSNKEPPQHFLTETRKTPRVTYGSTSKAKQGADVDMDGEDDEEDVNESKKKKSQKKVMYNNCGFDIVDVFVVYQKFKPNLLKHSLEFITSTFLSSSQKKVDLKEAIQDILTHTSPANAHFYNDWHAHSLIAEFWNKRQPFLPDGVKQLICFYNILDSTSCAQLMFTKERLFDLCRSLCCTVYMNVGDCIGSGQQKKFINVLEKYIHKSKMLLPYFERSQILQRMRLLEKTQEEQGESIYDVLERKDLMKDTNCTRFLNLMGEMYSNNLLVQIPNQRLCGNISKYRMDLCSKWNSFMRNNRPFYELFHQWTVEQKMAFGEECGQRLTSNAKRMGKGYQGAFVLEPHIGRYTDPIIVLDFRSLYPSIAIAQNLCYTTHIGSVHEMPEQLIETSPMDDKFVKRSVRQGVIPEALSDILQKRVEAKKKKLDSKQNALKLIANSGYGATGVNNPNYVVLPMVSIARSITSYGRKFLTRTVEIVEQQGLEIVARQGVEGFKVIYGDTDSVFIQARVSFTPPPAQIIQWGHMLAAAINMEMPPPMEILFEKYFDNFVIFSKKKYIGMKVEREDEPGKPFTRGTSSITRSYCPFVNEASDEVQNLMISGHWSKQEGWSIIFKQVKRLFALCYEQGEAKEATKKLLLTKNYDEDKNYVNTKLPHIHVVSKRKRRNSEDRIQKERIGYLFVDDGSIFTYGTLNNFFERAEDDAWIRQQLEKNVKVNFWFAYYFNNQYVKAIENLLVPIFIPPDEYEKKMKVFSMNLFGSTDKRLVTSYFSIKK